MTKEDILRQVNSAMSEIKVASKAMDGYVKDFASDEASIQKDTLTINGIVCTLIRKKYKRVILEVSEAEQAKEIYNKIKSLDSSN